MPPAIADRKLLQEAWSRGHGYCEVGGCCALAHRIVLRVPRHKGGRDVADNLMLVCRRHESIGPPEGGPI
jgi:hypothetical protein